MPDFISSWKTDNVGVSGDNQITLPLESSGTYNFTVDWGDGSQDTIVAWDDPAIEHTYPAPGTYAVTISGTIIGFRFNNGGDKLKILDVQQCGDLNLGNSGSYFYGCSNLIVSAIDALDLVGTLSLYRAFLNADLSVASGFDLWDVSSVTNMSVMFQNSIFNQDIGGWDVSSVTSMASMFRDSIFNQDIGGWDVSSVTSMASMFYNSIFNQDISGWDVSSVTSMASMFRDSIFNQDIGGWDVSSVTNFSNFNTSSFSTSFYDSILRSWSALVLQPNVQLGMGTSRYTESAARQSIIDTFGWTITDGGLTTVLKNITSSSAPLKAMESGLWLPSRELWHSAKIGRYGGVKWGGASYEIAQQNEWDELVGSWPMWRGAGYTVEDVNENHKGDFKNFTTPGWVRGPNGRGGAVEFNKTSLEYIDVDDIKKLDLASNVTVMLWVNVPEEIDGPIFSRTRGTVSSFYRTQMWVTADNELSITIANGQSSFGQSQPLSTSVGKWMHLAMVFDGTSTGNAARLRGYIDGVEQVLSFTNTIPANAAMLDNTYFGRHDGTADSFFTGTIGDVRVYIRSLSAVEIMNSYSLGSLSHILLRKRSMVLAFPTGVPTLVSRNQLVMC